MTDGSLPQEVRDASASAIDHAADLLDAAQMLRDDYPHLAFHFGVLHSKRSDARRWL